MLILSRKIDQKIRIGDNIVLTIIDIKGDQVKIGVEALIAHVVSFSDDYTFLGGLNVRHSSTSLK